MSDKQKKQPTGDYDVGYCRPPEDGKIKPGETRNPRGRPRKKAPAGDINAMLREALTRLRKVQRQGKEVRTTAMEAIIEQLVADIAKNPALRLKQYLPIISAAFAAVPPDEGGTGPDHGALFRAKIEEMADRFAAKAEREKNEHIEQAKRDLR